MNAIKLSILMIAAIFITAACSPSGSTSSTTVQVSTANRVSNVAPTASTPAVAQVTKADDAASEGKEIYATNCMICHKEDGTSGKVTSQGKSLEAENLTEDKFKKMTDEKLIAYVTNGIPD